MKTTTRTLLRGLLAVACGIMLAIDPAPAGPPPGKGKPNKHPNKVHKEKGHKHGDDSIVVSVASAGISAAAARALVIELGTDVSGYKPLPPGIRKNLARGKPLPPGIAKQLAPAPLIARLPKHAGHEWRAMGKDLVLVSIGTGVVADVLSDVF